MGEKYYFNIFKVIPIISNSSCQSEKIYFILLENSSERQCFPLYGTICRKRLNLAYGQRTLGGKLIKIASIFPPVFSPKSVPRS